MVRSEEEILQKKNRFLMIFWLGCLLFINVAYLIELVKGQKTPARILVYLLCAFVPYVITFVINRISEGLNEYICRYSAAGYALFYLVCLVTATKPIVTVYFVPFLLFLLLYEDKVLDILSFSFYGIINVAAILTWVLKDGRTDEYSVAQYEIQIGLCIMVIVSAVLFTRLQIEFSRFHREQIERHTKAAEETASRLSEASRKIGEQITEIRRNMDSNNQSVTSMNQSLSEVNAGMSAVANSLGTQTMATTKIQTEVDEIVEITRDLVNTANESDHSAASSNEHMNTVRKLTSGVKEESHLVIEEMKKLIENTNKVRGVIEIINGIAGQTNLLALNASIEAARAGEAGNGFHVVANEIRSLADSTKKSTGEIQQLLEQLSESCSLVDERIIDMTDEMNVQNESIDLAYEKVNLISRDLKILVEKVQMISSRMGNVDAGTDAVVEAINEMSAASEEISASATEVYELSNSTKEVSIRVSESVAGIEKNMNELV